MQQMFDVFDIRIMRASKLCIIFVHWPKIVLIFILQENNSSTFYLQLSLNLDADINLWKLS
jgi:hypothetical protein